ncbi:MAG: hypothetical protein IJ301_03860 [Clostridia bacterium]|nr:hypothetical protein [Clostridia bacterium]
MSIPRGNQREYYSRELTGHEVSQGIMQVGSGIANAIGTAQTVVERANESKLANYQIDLSNRFMQINNDINTKYQSDPTNPQRNKELDEAFSLLAGEYKVNPMVQGRWGEIKNNVLNNYKTYNARWELSQQQTNAQNDLKNGYEKLNNQISMLGSNGAKFDEVKLAYDNGISGLRNGATAVLGSEVTENFLKDANHDFMATYISALATNNPLEAQRMLQDNAVLNYIGNADTIEKLNDYVATSLKKQNEKAAVMDLGAALRKMNSTEADNLLSGRANLNQVTSFIEKNKSLTEGSKDLILSIYGIRSTNDYEYDSTKKRIVKKDSAGGPDGGTSIGNLKLDDIQKKTMAEQLEVDLHDMLENFGNEENIVKAKGNTKGNAAIDAHNKTIGSIKAIAEMQGRIDLARACGAINDSDRKRMMKTFIEPITKFIETNAEQFDEGSWIGGINKFNKLGYEKIKKHFDTTDLKGDELMDVQKQKLFAQNYYLDELNIAAKKLGMNSIYEIEGLDQRYQQEIYKTASENALIKAQRWTDKPEYFFAREFPDAYAMPFKMFGQEKSLMINRVVADEVYKHKFNGATPEQLVDIANNKMFEEMKKEVKNQQVKAATYLTQSQTMITPSDPKNADEFRKRIEALGMSEKQFYDEAFDRGMIKQKRFDYQSLQALKEYEYVKSLDERKR